MLVFLDVAIGSVTTEVPLPPEFLKRLTASTDGHVTLVGHDSGVWIFDAKGVLVRQLRLGVEEPLYDIALAPDGKTANVLLRGYVVGWIHLEEGAKVCAWRTIPGGVLARSGDSMVALVARSDRESERVVTLFDAKTLETVRTLDGERGGVSAALFAPDGATIATVGERLHVFDTATGRLLAATDVVRVRTLAFAPDGQTIYFGTETDELFAFSIPLQRRTWSAKPEGRIRALAVSPDGKCLAVSRGSVTVLDAATGRPCGPEPLPEAPSGDVGWVHALAYSPSGRTLAVGGEAIAIWDVRAATVASRIEVNEFVQGLSYLPDGTLVSAEGRDSGRVRRTDPATGEGTTLLETPDTLHGLAVSSDGKCVALVGETGKPILALDAATGSEVARLHVKEHVRSIGFAGGEMLLATSTDAGVSLRDTGTGGVMAEVAPQGECAPEIAVSIDGRIVVASHLSRDDVWLTCHNLTTGESTTLDGVGGPLALSRDGKLLAVGRKRSIQIYSTPTLQLVRALGASPQDVRSLVFRPDGEQLASGATDGTVFLWELH